MRLAKNKNIELGPEIYNQEYFLSDHLEGYREFKAGSISATKQKEVELLKLHKGLKILDIGFGRGELMLECAKQGIDIFGIDYSAAAYEIARALLKNYPNARVQIADCRNLPFTDNMFDRVFSGDVIEHLNYNDAIKMLQEAFRILKPGGFLLIHTTPNIIFSKFVYPLARPFLKLIDRQTIKAIDEQFKIMRHLHLHEFNLFSLKKIAKKAGFIKFNAWIDQDILRAGVHRLTQPFAANFLVKNIIKLSNWSALRFF
jgi:ubiquinone/menaquinone biosynthesis C-methylase UbiE